MAKRKSAVEIKEIIIRLRKKQGIREIHRESGVHRATIRTIKKTANDLGWLISDKEIPSEEQIESVFNQKAVHQKKHALDLFQNDFKRWIEEGLSFIVMHKFVQERYACSESTVRRYVQKQFPKKKKAVIRRPTIAGEIMEVDFGYLGMTYNPDKQKISKTYIFSGRLRHSRKAYREIVYNQKQETFFLCHIHAFEFFGGVPEKVVPDNLKAAVIKASYQNPMLNRAYRSMAEYYGFLISPNLPYHPQHKGGVENDIKYIKNNFWPIYKEGQYRLGREVPYCDDLKDDLERWSSDVADKRIIQGVGRSPDEIFKQEEKSALAKLPMFRHMQQDWCTRKAEVDCRIQYNKAFYSIPYQHIGKDVTVCANAHIIRIFIDYKEICSHPIASRNWEFVKTKEHFPPNYEEYLQTTKDGLIQRAKMIGPDTVLVIEKIFEDRALDGLRPARAVINLGRKYSFGRLEDACKRAIYYDTAKYISIKNILIKGLDEIPIEELTTASEPQGSFRFARGFGFFNKIIGEK